MLLYAVKLQIFKIVLFHDWWNSEWFQKHTLVFNIVLISHEGFL